MRRETSSNAAHLWNSRDKAVSAICPGEYPLVAPTEYRSEKPRRPPRHVLPDAPVNEACATFRKGKALLRVYKPDTLSYV